eukprot:3132234-Pleurochrysis_carterae.AAC.1
MYMNRGNHESLDMNVRSFHEGGGFAEEARARALESPSRLPSRSLTLNSLPTAVPLSYPPPISRTHVHSLTHSVLLWHTHTHSLSLARSLARSLALSFSLTHTAFSPLIHCLVLRRSSRLRYYCALRFLAHALQPFNVHWLYLFCISMEDFACCTTFRLLIPATPRAVSSRLFHSIPSSWPILRFSAPELLL